MKKTAKNSSFLTDVRESRWGSEICGHVHNICYAFCYSSPSAGKSAVLLLLAYMQCHTIKIHLN